VKPRTLADLRAEGRDPLSLLGVDRALLLDPAWLARAEAGAPLLFWDDEDDDRPAPTPYELHAGVAVLDVEGPIAQRGWFCIDGYDTLAANLNAALGDASVRSVLLRVNSPGGAAAGCFEWTREMRARVVASGKRVVAYADEMMCSGAYAVACVADEIVTPGSGYVGSVGVIASMRSWAKANEMEGLDVRVIRSGVEKADGHPDLPMDDAAVARAQADIDALAGMFFAWVGERRRMTPDAVRALEAGVRMGAEAVAAGLADRVLGYHALLAEMTAAASAAPTRAPMRAPGASRASSSRGTPMNEETLAALAAATGEADPDKAVNALLSLHRDAAKNETALTSARATVEKLSTDLAAANDRAAAAEKRVEGVERDAVIASAKAAGQWAPSLEGFLSGLDLSQLRAWQASAPAVVPQGEVKSPAEEPRSDVQLPADVAGLVAKGQRDGWESLTAAEKHAVTRAAPAAADAMRGKPAAPARKRR